MTPHNKTETPPKAAIEALYVGESLSLRETAARLGVSISPLQRWMRELGIPVRTVAQARKVAKKHVYSEETLAKMRQRAEAMRLRITPEASKRGGEKRKDRLAHNKGKPMSEETKQKLRDVWQRPGYREWRSEMLRGERSPHWRGGEKSELNARLDRWEWRETRKRVYARDNCSRQHI